MLPHRRAKSESCLPLLAPANGISTADNDEHFPSCSPRSQYAKSDLSMHPGDTLDSKCFVKHNFLQGEFSNPLFSLPLMEPIMNLARKYSHTENVERLEDELICALNDAMNDSCSPWSKFLPGRPPVVGPRTPEHYLCALDIAINARNETRRRRKVAKYWKRLALETFSSEEDVPLTPSPSDISDTGLFEALPAQRKDRLEELIAKRRDSDASYTTDYIDHGCVTSAKFDALSLTPLALDAESSVSDASHSPDPPVPITEELSTSPVYSSGDELDQTLVNFRADSATTRTRSFIPSLKRRQTLTPPTSPEGGRLTPTSIVLPKTHTCCNKSRTSNCARHDSESISLSPVQTKLRLYESLSAHPSPSPTRPQRNPRGPTRSRASSSTLSRTMGDGDSGERRSICTLTSDQTVIPRPKFSLLPQARRGIISSSFNKKYPHGVQTTTDTMT